jgi:hypothetical protein
MAEQSNPEARVLVVLRFDRITDQSRTIKSGVHARPTG